ncbi:dnaJ homolog subfamily C member 8-like [Branchiostoma lanceolatum]|uniref:DNAJC8 protein n=1 Tax=Branchiostoma lanceolatum TaxID=7740 RepID=A0A8J9YM78_BRALA|nr:DNAJC8 [Branchiostoma lanceolatum]
MSAYGSSQIGAGPSSANAVPGEHVLEQFMTEVKEIEVRDSVLTSKQQIDRLLRPGATYFNLNPFEVLQLDIDATPADVKKRYRQLSILIHPDKNPEDHDRAEAAFDAVNKAYKMLDNEDAKRRCMDVVEEAKAHVDNRIKEKRKQLKKEGKSSTVEEDDPVKFKHALWVMMCKLFADRERKRREQEQREADLRKRAADEEAEEVEKAKRQKEWEKQWEAKREERVDSWRSWQQTTKPKPEKEKKVKKEKKPPRMFKPPKHKMEQR